MPRAAVGQSSHWVHRRFDAPDGGIMHVEVRVGDTVVMLADADEAHPAFPIWLHVYVPDVDAAYARALEAGGEAVQAPVQKPGDPDRRERRPPPQPWTPTA